MEELLVILGALVLLTLSIAAMNIYKRRTDVLTGRYISNGNRQQAAPDKETNDLTRQRQGNGPQPNDSHRVYLHSPNIVSMKPGPTRCGIHD